MAQSGTFCQTPQLLASKNHAKSLSLIQLIYSLREKEYKVLHMTQYLHEQLAEANHKLNKKSIEYKAMLAVATAKDKELSEAKDTNSGLLMRITALTAVDRKSLEGAAEAYIADLNKHKESYEDLLKRSNRTGAKLANCDRSNNQLTATNTSLQEQLKMASTVYAKLEKAAQDLGDRYYVRGVNNTKLKEQLAEKLAELTNCEHMLEEAMVGPRHTMATDPRIAEFTALRHVDAVEIARLERQVATLHRQIKELQKNLVAMQAGAGKDNLELTDTITSLRSTLKETTDNLVAERKKYADLKSAPNLFIIDQLKADLATSNGLLLMAREELTRVSDRDEAKHKLKITSEHVQALVRILKL